MPLPEDMPARFTGPAAWEAADLLGAPALWRTVLAPDTIRELEAAAAYYLSLGRDIGEITAEDFPLPTFSAHLAALREKLTRGIGAEVLTGLPVAQYTQQTAATIFCGVGAHLGSARSQNAAGHILGHVRDVGSDPKDTATRIYQTSARQTFHTDSADWWACSACGMRKRVATPCWSAPRRSATACARRAPTCWRCSLIPSRPIGAERCPRG